MLLKFPGEIADNIYEFCSPPTTPAKTTFFQGRPAELEEVQVLRVCQKVHDEAAKIFYGNKTFVFSAGWFEKEDSMELTYFENVTWVPTHYVRLIKQCIVNVEAMDLCQEYYKKHFSMIRQHLHSFADPLGDYHSLKELHLTYGKEVAERRLIYESGWVTRLGAPQDCDSEQLSGPLQTGQNLLAPFSAIYGVPSVTVKGVGGGLAARLAGAIVSDTKAVTPVRETNEFKIIRVEGKVTTEFSRYYRLSEFDDLRTIARLRGASAYYRSHKYLPPPPPPPKEDDETGKSDDEKDEPDEIDDPYEYYDPDKPLEPDYEIDDPDYDPEEPDWLRKLLGKDPPKEENADELMEYFWSLPDDPEDAWMKKALKKERAGIRKLSRMERIQERKERRRERIKERKKRRGERMNETPPPPLEYVLSLLDAKKYEDSSDGGSPDEDSPNEESRDEDSPDEDSPDEDSPDKDTSDEDTPDEDSLDEEDEDDSLDEEDEDDSLDEENEDVSLDEEDEDESVDEENEAEKPDKENEDKKPDKKDPESMPNRRKRKPVSQYRMNTYADPKVVWDLDLIGPLAWTIDEDGIVVATRKAGELEAKLVISESLFDYFEYYGALEIAESPEPDRKGGWIKTDEHVDVKMEFESEGATAATNLEGATAATKPEGGTVPIKPGPDLADIISDGEGGFIFKGEEEVDVNMDSNSEDIKSEEDTEDIKMEDIRMEDE